MTGVRTFPAGTDPVKTEDDGTLTSAMSRGALHVRISAGANDVEFVVCHLKSKLLHFPSRALMSQQASRRRTHGARDSLSHA